MSSIANLIIYLCVIYVSRGFQIVKPLTARESLLRHG